MNLYNDITSNVDLCGEQETCEMFGCDVSTRNHHVRITKPCTFYGLAICPQLTGQACNLEKIRKVKTELKTAGKFNV